MGQHDAAESSQQTPPEQHAAGSIPAPLTPLIGRGDELRGLLARLRAHDCRLVTLMGAGGVGKTRLALEAAAQLQAEGASPFAHGTYMVALAAHVPSEPIAAGLATMIARALGLALAGPDAAPLQLRNYLRAKSMLLLLDNFEHLLGAAGFVAGLLEAAPGLTVLVTSRERLRLRGEWVIDLDGLAVPPPDAALAPEDLERYDATRLFVARMQALVPEAAIDAATAQAIGRVCSLVAGLPLGVELAASWTRLVSCAEIARELERSLDFLAADAPDLPARQRSLRAVFDSSWRMLSAAEQQALRQLAVFRGSWTREAAAQVAGASLQLIGALVDKSLLRRAPAIAGPSSRYVLAEPVRPFAAERLAASGEAEATAARHASFYLGMLAQRRAELRGPEQPAALAALSAEVDEIRAAWRWAVASKDVERLAQAADGLFHLHDMRSWFAEGAEAFDAASKALAGGAAGPPRLTWARLLARQGWFVFHLGHPADARALLEQSLPVLRDAGDVPELAWALSYLGAVCTYLGDYAATEALCRESLTLGEDSGDPYAQVIALSVLCQNAYERGDYAAAAGWGERSLALEEHIGSPWSVAYSLTNLARVVAARGEHTRARGLFEKSLRIRRELGDLRGAALCLNRMGAAEAAEGHTAASARHYLESLALFRRIGNQWGIASALLSLGGLATAQGAEGPATRLLREALQLALATKTAPQAREAAGALAQLATRAGAGPWAAQIGQPPDQLPQPLLNRLLEWAGRTPETLDEALAAAQSLAEASASRPAPATSPAPRSARSYPAGLTPREVEVLQLVAEGLTDADVAERLVLSRRTVHAHLSSVYSKLAVGNRSAATRFAVEHGLV
jgi:predicted ATPase/DNA-binding CsgD family transcriptional regulator